MLPQTEAVKADYSTINLYMKENKLQDIISQPEAAICCLYYYVIDIHHVRRYQVGSSL